MPAFHSDRLDPKEVLVWIEDHPGAFTNEVKEGFGNATSKEARRALGVLMANNKVIPMAHLKGVAWCPVTGKRGKPSVVALRKPWAESNQAKHERRQEEKRLRWEAEHSYSSEGQVLEEVVDLKYDDPMYHSKKPGTYTRLENGRLVVNIGHDPDEPP
jgi:hypothetical protein